MIDCVVKNGLMVFPEGLISCGIAIEDGKITAVAKEPNLPAADKVIDAGGKVIIPGVIDPHSHLGHSPRGGSKDSWKEAVLQQIGSETASAAAGGVTTFFTLLGQGEKIPFEEAKKAVDDRAYVDMAFHVGIGNAEHLDALPLYAAHGITSFKFHMVEYPNFRVAAADDGLIFLGLGAIRDLGPRALPLFHCENLSIYYRLKDRLKAQGRMDPEAWADARPNLCEEESMRRVMFLAGLQKAPVYIVHMSICEGVDLVAEQRQLGLRVIAETCPHYLSLTRRDQNGLLGKINPPLRAQEDVDALWRGLRDGVIDCIGSDHVVAMVEDQQSLDVWDPHNVGFAGTETMLPVMLSEGVNRGLISLQRLVEVCSRNTAQALGLFPRKGTLQVGSDADLVIVDLKKEVDVSVDILHSASDYTIYEGRRFRGWPILTMVRGAVVMDQGIVVGKPGYGEYLPRSLTSPE